MNRRDFLTKGFTIAVSLSFLSRRAVEAVQLLRFGFLISRPHRFRKEHLPRSSSLRFLRVYRSTREGVILHGQSRLDAIFLCGGAT